MSYSLSAELKGVEELQRAFNEAPHVVVGEAKDAVNKTAYQVLADAKQGAPVQHGGLRGSITTAEAIVVQDDVQAVVGTNLKYAPHQEFGTGIYAGKGMIIPKRAKVLAWKKNGKWIFAKAVRGVPGTFYFRKAFHNGKLIFTHYMDEAITKIVRRLEK
ncbi:MAG: HK97 gp10 family phage protein [bacterium]|nr:HK97 gp10 family phage protein [bacterium]